MTLRRLTRPEAALTAACVCLLVLALRPRPTPPPRVVTHTDTVPAAQIAAQEPPAKPSLPHRLAYREVKPTRTQVAPGAGDSLLAALCDTTGDHAGQKEAGSAVNGNLSKPDTAFKGGAGADSSARGQPQPAPALPALVYAGKLSQPWHPWGRQKLTLFAVSREGESVTEYRIHAPAEWRSVPVPVVREGRTWRRALKPLPFVAGVFAAGYVTGVFTR